MNDTPRTDAAYFKQGATMYDLAGESKKLENELAAAKAERDLAITRVASILWSGAIDKHTCGDVQKWVEEYTAELAAMQARAELAEAGVERLKGLASWANTCIHHNDAERARYGHVCPVCTSTRAEKAEAALTDPQQLHAHCLRTLNEGQIAHLFGERMTEIVNRAEKMEAELAAEREKVRVLREALELITNQTDACQAFCDTFTPSSRIKARVALHVTKEASK